jgi:hypothetical protein
MTPFGTLIQKNTAMVTPTVFELFIDHGAKTVGPEFDQLLAVVGLLSTARAGEVQKTE